MYLLHVYLAIFVKGWGGLFLLRFQPVSCVLCPVRHRCLYLNPLPFFPLNKLLKAHASIWNTCPFHVVNWLPLHHFVSPAAFQLLLVHARCEYSHSTCTPCPGSLGCRRAEEGRPRGREAPPPALGTGPLRPGPAWRPRHVARLLRARPWAGRSARLAGRKMAAGIREKQTGERLPAAPPPAPGLGAGLPEAGRGSGGGLTPQLGLLRRRLPFPGGSPGRDGGFSAPPSRLSRGPPSLLAPRRSGAPGARPEAAAGRRGARGPGTWPQPQVSARCGGARGGCWARGELWPRAGSCHPCGGCPTGWDRRSTGNGP